MLHIVHIRNFGVCKVNKKNTLTFPSSPVPLIIHILIFVKKCHLAAFPSPIQMKFGVPPLQKKVKKNLLFARGRPVL
jgi:hypothetical protein